MSDNPYAPPKARLEDVLPPQEKKSRPRQIVLAVQLAAVGYVLGIAVIALSWDYYSKLQPLLATIVGQLVSGAMTAWIYYKIYMGRNWARMTLLVLSVLAMLMVFNQMFVDLIAKAPVIAKAKMFLSLGITLAVLWLLFFSPGRAWFSEERPH